ncbi:hypothetical protein SKAU_G00226390 [Synaphobranchus kaupii]|uniref:Uncharacterized protein n=1 Tax=Synaphobranchus kaupii TaxID=118154 RepID=A0A9Q1F4X8_SYNKA|nr:hypothetical protein SKAU_G00226390 [Synaphobranchus kaupii]
MPGSDRCRGGDKAAADSNYISCSFQLPKAISRAAVPSLGSPSRRLRLCRIPTRPLSVVCHPGVTGSPKTARLGRALSGDKANAGVRPPSGSLDHGALCIEWNYQGQDFGLAPQMYLSKSQLPLNKKDSHQSAEDDDALSRVTVPTTRAPLQSRKVSERAGGLSRGCVSSAWQPFSLHSIPTQVICIRIQTCARRRYLPLR